MTGDRAGTPTPTLWGLDVRALHDRYWWSRGVRVVRRGTPAPLGTARRGATTLHLLVDADDLVLCDLPWGIVPSATGRLRVRVVDAERAPYREEVIADDDGCLVALRRRYAERPRALRSVYVTGDTRVADAWRSAPTRRDAAVAMRRAAGPGSSACVTCRGRVAHAHRASDAARFADALLRIWRNVPDAVEDVHERRPGVFAHTSATIDPTARCVPPIWLGAGVTLLPAAVVAGPRIERDRVALPPALPPAAALARGAARPAPAPLPPPPPGTAPRARRRPGKRTFDIVFSIAALLVSAPLFPFIMLAIWLEDGRPFVFAHRRQTRGGRHFTCFKFRTMCRDAEGRRDHLAGENVCDGPQFHIVNDPRLLRVGRLLRALHLDELPQFVNVLLGQMSVVGPRPSPHEENQYCPAWREARLSVRPGVTGLWQVCRTRARGVDFQEWIRYDLDYVAHANWRLDLWILWRTARTIVVRAVRMPGRRRRGAASPALVEPRLTVPAAPIDAGAVAARPAGAAPAGVPTVLLRSPDPDEGS